MSSLLQVTPPPPPPPKFKVGATRTSDQGSQRDSHAPVRPAVIVTRAIGFHLPRRHPHRTRRQRRVVERPGPHNVKKQVISARCLSIRWASRHSATYSVCLPVTSLYRGTLVDLRPHGGPGKTVIADLRQVGNRGECPPLCPSARPPRCRRTRPRQGISYEAHTARSCRERTRRQAIPYRTGVRTAPMRRCSTPRTPTRRTRRSGVPSAARMGPTAAP